MRVQYAQDRHEREEHGVRLANDTTSTAEKRREEKGKAKAKE